MKKMKLNLEELKVQSFETNEVKNVKGTVVGEATKGHVDCAYTVHVACSEPPHDPCYTNPGGCSAQQCSMATCGPLYTCNDDCWITDPSPACGTGNWTDVECF